MIDTTVLNYKDEILIDEEVVLDDAYISQSEIKALSPVKLVGKLNYTMDDKIEFNFNASGVMTVEDAISLQEIAYPFALETTEIYESLQKTIDIKEVLWQNIVLEIPLKYTLEKDLNKFHGDGWKLVSEDEERKNSLADLIENMEKE